MIKKLFNMLTGRGSTAVKTAPEQTSPASPVLSIDNVVKFVDYVVKSLVDNPNEVRIDLKKGERDQTININCKKEDIGKIIGKNGKTIMAIRTLVSGTASRVNQQINVEVVDQIAS